MKHHHQYQQHHAPPAAADSIEDGITVHHHSRHPYDDDPDDKRRHRRRRHGQSSAGRGWAGCMLLLLVVGMAVGGLLLMRGGEEGQESTTAAAVVGRAKAVAKEAFAGASAKTLVQEGLAAFGPKGRAEVEAEEEEGELEQAPAAAAATADTASKSEEPAPPLPRSLETWEERQASGRHVLQTGVDVALRELMETRGFANASRVQAPNFEGALSFFARAAELFAQTYDGKDEVIESDYFDAIELQALLRLYQGECAALDALLDGAQRTIDLDPQERSAVALLRGYCEEGQGSSKAGMYFALAREYDPVNCHETLLDATYQPPTYGTSRMPDRGDGYWGHLLDLMVFRSLYTHRARLANEGSTWPGSLWAAEPQKEGDAFGANLGWGMNQAGVAKAGEILRGQDFVVLREFLHPFELAVLERYYRAKAAADLPFDANLGRISSYQDRVGMWLNHRMTQLVASFVGRPIKHAYSFLCHYEKRDGVIPHLQPHTDREDNQYTVSIQIYADKEEPLWPIYVAKDLTLPEHSSWRPLPSKEDSVECGVRNGDALLFLGRRHVHFRDDMPEELSVVASLLLHFVDREMDLFDYKMRQEADPSI